MVQSICRCICGSGHKSRDPLDPATTWHPKDIEVFDEIDEPPFQLPQIDGRWLYSILADQPLRGKPIREGELWHLSSEEKVELVHFSLYINGFTFESSDKETSISLSPFSLVRTCKFQNTCPKLKAADLRIFKVALFSQNTCHFFGIKAEEDRGEWVNDISRAMRLVTQSIFPPFTISCEPLNSVSSTQRRLMAGYLVHRDDDYFASVLYGELHPHSEDKAKLVFYENEVCLTPVMDVYITEDSVCCEKIGINCSCFSIEDHQFSTRTLSERRLWLRAISNLKVKLKNRAPSPTNEELKHFRLSIKEHISSIKADFNGQVQNDPLLQRCLCKPWKPWVTVTAAPVSVLTEAATVVPRDHGEPSVANASAGMPDGPPVDCSQAAQEKVDVERNTYIV